ncbi:transglycosylase SLT domain-containing protein [Streptomyces sp. NPDC090073]|uniref:transglycosylase SLT domain-containing protein n=1 Tax=Streptomyces sp. NPDC090073 TaxID=3365936 RepID=UPI003812C23E
MSTLTYKQIVRVARAGGLPGDPEVWAAVAMAESSGRTDVVNSIGCVGLWQINQPAHVGSHPTWTVSWLSNPINNARAAAVIYHQQGWDAWEAYTGPSGHGSSGPWRAYYQKNSKHAAESASWWGDFWNGFKDGFDTGPGPEDLVDGGTGNDPDVMGGLGDVAKGIGTIAEAVAKTAVWLGNSKNWVRIGYVAGGGVLVALGLTIVARPVLSGTPAARAAKAGVKAVKTKRQAKAKAGAQGGDGGGE